MADWLACLWARPLHNLLYPLVVGGVLVAGGLVEPDGGHGEAALLGQVRQVCGDQGGRGWYKVSRI